MPIHLPPISRRRFLATTLAAVGGLMVRRSWATESSKLDPARIALFSDTHLAGDKAKISREVCMWTYFEKARANLLAGEKLPSMLMINGDLALDNGQPADYETVIDGLRPFREAGMPVHLNMGNHDHRENFWKAIAPADTSKVVDAKHVSIVETPGANWIMLDSLEETAKTPGLLGDAQLKWLGKSLDGLKEKPAIVIVHHNPNLVANPKIAGLKETKALMDILLPRKQVKALIFGHTHKWIHTKVEDLHLINLPPVAYPFGKGDVSGWVDVTMKETSATLKLNAVDPKHPQNGEVVELKYRS